jgi:hypothetical protein
MYLFFYFYLFFIKKFFFLNIFFFIEKVKYFFFTEKKKYFFEIDILILCGPCRIHWEIRAGKVSGSPPKMIRPIIIQLIITRQVEHA